MERDGVSPTVATLMRISDSLGVGLTHFFTASPGSGNHLVRRGERSTLVSRASGARHELLKAPTNECALNPMLVTLDPGSRSGDGPHAHAGEEFVLVMKGRLRFRVAEQEYLLHRGHSLTFPSTLPHAWWNPYAAPAEAIWVSRGDFASRVDMIDHERRQNGRPGRPRRGRRG
jgi:quercetin dioxygenase-like cupin family protein